MNYHYCACAIIFLHCVVAPACYAMYGYRIICFNHFSTTGRCSGPAHYDVSIRQAARAAFVTSSFKIFLTQTFPRCGATCFILPSRAMTQLFNGVNGVSLSGSLFNILQLFASFSQNLKLLQWRTVLATLTICRIMF